MNLWRHTFKWKRLKWYFSYFLNTEVKLWERGLGFNIYNWTIKKSCKRTIFWMLFKFNHSWSYQFMIFFTILANQTFQHIIIFYHLLPNNYSYFLSHRKPTFESEGSTNFIISVAMVSTCWKVSGVSSRGARASKSAHKAEPWRDNASSRMLRCLSICK